MAPTRHPLIDLVYNDETGRYIAMLERKLLVLTQSDIRFRALLELLTDESWDDYQFKEEDGEIRKIAMDALMRRLGISESDARKIVADRWQRHNPDPAPDHTRTYLIGKTPTPHVISQARPAVGYDVEKHLAGIEQAKQRRLENATQQLMP